MNSNSLPKLLFGGFLIFLGIGFLAQQYIPGINFGTILSYFWPVVFILIGINIIVRTPKSPLFGIFFIVWGLALIVDDFINFSIWSLWPLILVFFGVSVILGKDFNEHFKSNTTEDLININTMFWGSENTLSSKTFKGGQVNVAFGGVKLDLRNIEISNEGAVLEINVMFGGVEVVLPGNINVIADGAGFFGGFENKAVSSNKGNLLKINGSAIFGGVQIK